MNLPSAEVVGSAYHFSLSEGSKVPRSACNGDRDGTGAGLGQVSPRGRRAAKRNWGHHGRTRQSVNSCVCTWPRVGSPAVKIQ